MKITNWCRKFGRCSSKRRQRLLASLAAAGVAGTGSLAQADIMTTLTGLGDTNVAVPVNHGSTSETTLTWSVGGGPGEEPNDWDQYADWNVPEENRGEVYQVNNLMTDITFAPTSSSVKLTIQSFDLDEYHYFGADDTEVDWKVTGSSSGVIAMGTWDLKNNMNDPGDLGGRDLISPNATGVRGETLTLAFDHTSGYVSYLAMDNLTFLSTVPEPATAVMAWLGVGGLGAMAIRRKRK